MVPWLTAPAVPGDKGARKPAAWADPRATGFFITSRPVPACLDVLNKHAPHLLLADDVSACEVTGANLVWRGSAGQGSRTAALLVVTG
ncbi:hypothetical protein [Streptomyces sp. NPDC046985]|uniref:hypothetical protein n=1 Tax=Streptomyces sp. NPDC046985 TaxID=3155377 RepID=UPI00340CDB59